MESSHRVRGILAFVQAADTGSFAAAGRQLDISAAAVSKSMAGLEEALGVRLFNRTTRSLQLTEEGAVFLRQARVALDALDAAIDSVAASSGEPTGSVKISTSAAFGREQLMPVLPRLLSRYPGISIAVDFDDRMVDLVRNGYDLALRGGNLRDSGLISRPVCRLNTILVAAPAYLAEAGVPRAIDDLRRHRLVARRFLSGAIDMWSMKAADGSITTLDPSQLAALTLSAPETVVEAARYGIGIAQVGVHLALHDLQAGRLQTVLPLQHHPGNYEMALQYPHRALMAPRVRVVLDGLLDAFASDPTLHVPLDSLASYAA